MIIIPKGRSLSIMEIIHKELSDAMLHETESDSHIVIKEKGVEIGNLYYWVEYAKGDVDDSDTGMLYLGYMKVDELGDLKKRSLIIEALLKCFCAFLDKHGMIAKMECDRYESIAGEETSAEVKIARSLDFEGEWSEFLDMTNPKGKSLKLILFRNRK